MIPLKWSLIDIETNGVSAKRDCITEIAIITIENWRIVETWSTLIKPRHSIPYQIEQLTGISNAMVDKACYFEEIADIVFDKLNGKLFVAHNARFDYAFIKNAFSKAGMLFSAKVLCTVKLSRKLFPQYKNHRMDSLVERFELKTVARHRAMYDADLVYQFLKQCRKEFGQEELESHIKSIVRCASLPSYLKTPVEEIPDSPGVYLFYGENQDVPIYIGKSIHLRRRILSHFSSDYASSKELKISQQVREIKWIETAGELGALLLESQLIKEKIPIYNQRLRKAKYISCFHLVMVDGFYQIKIVHANEQEALAQKDLIGCFKSKRAAENILRELITNHRLCPKLCGLDNSKKSCFHYQLKKCQGACINKESSDIYNARVEMAMAQFKLQEWPFDGPVGIKEQNNKNQQIQFHVFNQWRYLGSVCSLSELQDTVNTLHETNTTYDDIKIIQSHIKKVQSTDIVAL